MISSSLAGGRVGAVAMQRICHLRRASPLKYTRVFQILVYE